MPLSRFFERRVSPPLALRGIALLATIVGLSVFFFWATADVLGGYNGYGWSLEAHPLLREVYLASGLSYIGRVDAGTEAALFFGVALVGFVILRLRSGLWNALRDATTLFAAPILGFFELSLWNYAPNDMTWHVVDALWLGGTNDGGWRSFDAPGSAFIFSNWFVLMVCVLLLASRIPMLGLPSEGLAGMLTDFSIAGYARRLVALYRRFTDGRPARQKTAVDR